MWSRNGDAAAFVAAGLDVVHQARGRRAGCASRARRRAERRDLRRVDVVGQLRSASASGLQAAADEAAQLAADLGRLAVEQRDAVAQVVGVEVRQVDVAVGEVGGAGKAANSSAYCRRTASSMSAVRSPSTPAQSCCDHYVRRRSAERCAARRA
jgi:hypothetical protein